MNDPGLLTKASWLLLIHQRPAKPAYARVKVSRRLQALGAVTVKNAVYALPSNEETQEDFAWLAREIVELGGEALVCEAALIEGLDDRQLAQMFVAARNEDYAKLLEEARSLERRLAAEPDDAEVAAQAVRARRQLGEVAAIDFFSADGRDAAERLITTLETRLQERSDAMNLQQGLSASQSPLMAKVWVTREHV